jgi:hypothetical protein
MFEDRNDSGSEFDIFSTDSFTYSFCFEVHDLPPEAAPDPERRPMFLDKKTTAMHGGSITHLGLAFSVFSTYVDSNKKACLHLPTCPGQWVAEVRTEWLFIMRSLP